MFGVSQLNDLLFQNDALEAITAIRMAIRKQLEFVAIVRHNGEAVLHQNLEIAALIGLPVHHERHAALTDVQAFRIAKSL